MYKRQNADSVTENSDKELAEEFNKDDSLLEESTGSIGSVSYTHLDVYKRQHIFSIQVL